MKIIFITSPGQDNLEDSVLHGFRTLFGADCVDYPKKQPLYRDYIPKPGTPIYGRLFTIWRTLDNISIDRENIDDRIQKGDYDLVIFGSIHRSYDLFREYKPFLRKERTILIDGEDPITLMKGVRGFLYFKRELVQKARYYYTYKMTPRFIYRRLPPPKMIRPISFSIPKEKITWGIGREAKTQMFPHHIVDDEIRQNLLEMENAGASYMFDSEEDYFRDLRRSRFGITMRRGGWDCLRHYEIAANGAVICFRDLSAKSPYSAPHGLDASNTLIYSSSEDLKRQIDTLSDEKYDHLLANGYEWIKKQTTEARATEIIDVQRSMFGK